VSREPPELIGRLPDQYFTRIVRAAAQARAQPGPRYIDLGRGNPDIPPPPHALAALGAAVGETGTPAVHGYAPFDGHRELREAIAARYAADHGVELDPDSEVAVLPGTKTGIMLLAQAAAGAGDLVAVPDPGYPDYFSGVALAGARTLALPLTPEGHWQPDFDAVAPGPVALTLLNYPANPVAACERPGTFERALAFAHEREGWLVHDLAYDGFAFDGRSSRSVLEVDGAREVAAELWSPSKVYGMAGWRIGFLVGNTELVRRVNLLLSHTAVSVFTALQRGLVAALRDDQSDVRERVAVYAARRDRLLARLQRAGARLAVPEGTFYAWWKLPEGLTAERLVRERRVGVAAGEGFGERGAGWARLSLAVADADLDEGAERLVAALQGTSSM